MRRKPEHESAKSVESQSGPLGVFPRKMLKLNTTRCNFLASGNQEKYTKKRFSQWIVNYYAV